MRVLVQVIGLAALLTGLLVAGQGLGYIPLPQNSFMIGDMHWAYYGAGIAAAGLVLVLLSRRRRDLRRLRR
jgi:hypothetical protein